MVGDAVCAVAVTFHPRAEHLRNLAKMRSQVAELVVVDNGSREDTLKPLRAASEQSHFVLIENGENLGIGTALNIGVRWAQARGPGFVVLFDQDSAITDHFIAQMLGDYAEISSRLKLGLLVPRYVDPVSGAERTFELAEDGGPFVTITSGSFLHSGIFHECGYFQENLFIYTVDDEYSLRLRSRGFSIAQSRQAILLHGSGAPTDYRVFGIRLFSATNHSPGARYYLNRNRVWLARTYGRAYPGLAYWLLRASIKETVKIVLAEKRISVKLMMVARGVLDGLRMRMGKTIDL